jgi:Zn-dependent protease
MQLTEQTFFALVAVAVMLVIGFPVHEFMHAWAAHKLGDDTARWQGRLTLDPRTHFDPMGGTLLVLSALFSSGFFLGWAKPTPVNPMNLRGGPKGEALVAVAGPLSNLVLAAVVAVVFRVLLANADALLDATSFQLINGALNVTFYFVMINVSLFVFNLLPVPPLDGWRALLGLVPPRTNWQLRTLEARYALVIPIIFLAFIFIGGSRIISPIVARILDVLVGIS